MLPDKSSMNKVCSGTQTSKELVDPDLGQQMRTLGKVFGG